jgi:NADH dehydrogenase
MPKKVIIVGGGFAGLNAAKKLGGVRDIEVTLIDRKNHHLFQPLLYQVATAGLSPADIAAPIRHILSRYKNVKVLLGEVNSVDLDSNQLNTSNGKLDYDYLVMAPGLKTIEQATEIRRNILTAFEIAERSTIAAEQRKHLTFVIIGGGPTGVEMAGAIGEMSRFTLAKDFRNINAKSTRVFLMEGGPRILPMFPEKLSDRAARDLEQLGVQVWTGSLVTAVDDEGVTVGSERIEAATVIWAAGVQASSLGKQITSASGSSPELDRQGRIPTRSDLSIAGHPNVFVAGDQAHFKTNDGLALPGVAPVATQQGRHVAKMIRSDIAGDPRKDFHYTDKGMMATVGRNKAIMKSGKWEMGGRFAWLAWLVVHIYFLTGFRNRFFVVLSWAWSYFTFRRGARLIVGKGRARKFSDIAKSKNAINAND